MAANSDLYYPSGALYCKCCSNQREYFYEDGQLKTIEKIQDGRFDGKSILYWPNGKVKRECHFIQGARDGMDRMYAEDGTVLDEGEYKKGKPVGIHKRYNLKGLLIEKIEYLDPYRFNFQAFDDEGEMRVDAFWEGTSYFEKAWDRFDGQWVEKRGRLDGNRLIYL